MICMRTLFTVSLAIAVSAGAAHSQEVSGLLEPVRTAEVRPEIDASIVEVLISEGDKVVKGDLLIRFDDSIQRARVSVAAATPAEARIARAGVTAESAQSTFNRVEAAAKRGGAPKWEVAEARYVTEVSATEGETAARSETLLNVEDFSKLEATVFAPVEHRTALEAGKTYAARVGPPLDANVKATLRFVEPRIDPASQTIKAIFVIESGTLNALAGTDLFVDLTGPVQ